MNNSPLITVSEALELLKDGAIVFDASIDKVNQKLDTNHIELIPKSLFFDIEGELSDHESGLPHTMVDAAVFTQAMRKLGLNQDSNVIIYDRWGMYSSPRAWWMLRYMGFKEVYVLKGGLPAWKAQGQPITHQHIHAAHSGNFTAEVQKEWFKSKEDIKSLLGNPDYQIVDARSQSRFDGTSPEPRAGLSSGHIPGSNNLPFDQVINDIYFKEDAILKKIYEEHIPFDKPAVFTCGSGITASIIALGAYHLGHRQVSVYDGSWTEWASDPNSPIEKSIAQ